MHNMYAYHLMVIHIHHIPNHQCMPTVPDPDLKRSEKEEIAGLLNWNRPHQRAYGLSTTLYERHPLTSERAGEEDGKP